MISVESTDILLPCIHVGPAVIQDQRHYPYKKIISWEALLLGTHLCVCPVTSNFSEHIWLCIVLSLKSCVAIYHSWILEAWLYFSPQHSSFVFPESMSAILTETVSLTSTSRTHIVFAWLSEYIKIVKLHVLHAHCWSFLVRVNPPGPAQSANKSNWQKERSAKMRSVDFSQFGGGLLVSTCWYCGCGGFAGSDA